MFATAKQISRLVLLLVMAFATPVLMSPAFAHHLHDNSTKDWALSGQDTVIYNHLDGNEIRFMNKNSGKFLLHAGYGDNDAYRNVEVAPIPASYGRRYGFDWVLRPASPGHWFIVNLTSGLYLSWDGNDSNVSVWGNCPECGNDNLQWRFEKAEENSNTYLIINKGNGQGLDQGYHGTRSGENNVRMTSGQNTANGGWSWLITTSFPTLSRLRTLNIEKVKALSTSTGQDAGTKILFSGIDLAIQLGAAAASGGASTAMSAARAGTIVTRTSLKEAAKKAIKDKIKSKLKSSAGLSKADLAKAGLNAATNGGGTQSTVNSAAEIASSVLDAMSSEYLFNKIYGNSPDDLDIQVNGSSIFPGGGRADGRKISSQQTLQVNREVIFYHDLGFSLDLIEYDSASADDNLGGITWKDPTGIIRQSDIVGQNWLLTDLYETQRFEDVLFTNESEGSSYLVTFTVSALRPVGGELYDRYFKANPTHRGREYITAKQKADDRNYQGSNQWVSDEDQNDDYERLRAGKQSPTETCLFFALKPQRERSVNAFARSTFANTGRRAFKIYQINAEGEKVAPYQINSFGVVKREAGVTGPIRVEPGATGHTFTNVGAIILLEDDKGSCVGRVKIKQYDNDFSYDPDVNDLNRVAGQPISPSTSVGGGAQAPIGQPVAPAPVLLSAGASCHLRGNFASPQNGSTTAQNVWLQNNGSTDLLLFWLNPQGAETNYASMHQPIDTLAPGDNKNFPIADGAGYLVTDAFNNCNAVIVVQPGDNRYALAADPNASPTGNYGNAGGTSPADPRTNNDYSAVSDADYNACLSATQTSDSALYDCLDLALQNSGGGQSTNTPQNAGVETRVVEDYALVPDDDYYVCQQTDPNRGTPFFDCLDTALASANGTQGQNNPNAGASGQPATDPRANNDYSAVSEADWNACLPAAQNSVSAFYDCVDLVLQNSGGGQNATTPQNAGVETRVVEDYALVPDDDYYACQRTDPTGGTPFFDCLDMALATANGTQGQSDPNAGASAQPATDPRANNDYSAVSEADWNACQPATQNGESAFYDCVDLVLQNSGGGQGVQESDPRHLKDYRYVPQSYAKACEGVLVNGDSAYFDCLDSYVATTDTNGNAGKDPGWDRADVFYQPAYDHCVGQLQIDENSSAYSDCYFAFPNYTPANAAQSPANDNGDAQDPLAQLQAYCTNAYQGDVVHQCNQVISGCYGSYPDLNSPNFAACIGNW